MALLRPSKGEGGDKDARAQGFPFVLSQLWAIVRSNLRGVFYSFATMKLMSRLAAPESFALDCLI